MGGVVKKERNTKKKKWKKGMIGIIYRNIRWVEVTLSPIPTLRVIVDSFSC